MFYFLILLRLIKWVHELKLPNKSKAHDKYILRFIAKNESTINKNIILNAFISLKKSMISINDKVCHEEQIVADILFRRTSPSHF